MPPAQDDPTAPQPTPPAEPELNEDGTPKTPEPPKQDDAVEARVALAREQGRNEALQQTIDRLAAGKQDPVPTSDEKPLPDDPMDLLTPKQREDLELQMASGGAEALKASKFIAQLASKLERAKLERQADPMVRGQASGYVDSFKTRMSLDKPELARQIIPLFDAMFNGVDLRPLVAMAPQARESELMMRWNAAKAQVLEKNMAAAPKPKPEPGLQNSGGPPSAPTPAERVKSDSFLAPMADKYKFTPEQLKQLEEVG